jgi:integrase/recombinase XerD
VSEGRLPADPTSGIKNRRGKGKGKRHTRQALTDNEVRRILDGPKTETPGGKRDLAMICLMAYCGARTVEVHNANTEDLDTDQGRLVLRVLGKGRDEKDEVVVLWHPEAEGAVRNWLAARGKQPGPLFTSLSPRSIDERLSLSAIREIVMHYFELAGVSGGRKSTHSLRHTAATNAVRHGAPVTKVQTMMRHADLATTMVYVHETDRVANPGEAFVDYRGD